MPVAVSVALGVLPQSQHGARGSMARGGSVGAGGAALPGTASTAEAAAVGASEKGQAQAAVRGLTAADGMCAVNPEEACGQ